MDNLEFIDNYCKGLLDTVQKQEFERRLKEDPAFAEDMAFYLSAYQNANTAQQARFDNYYMEYKEKSQDNERTQVKIRKLWPRIAAAAAVVLAIFFSWYLWNSKESPRMLADNYMLENFQSMEVKMGRSDDEIQKGLRLYNEGRQEEALSVFEDLTRTDTINTDAKKYAGIVSLRLGQYDKAISYFTTLSANTQLYANPGKFYHALTLMKRNQPGDVEQAKKLLEQVVNENQVDKEIAREWLKKW